VPEIAPHVLAPPPVEEMVWFGHVPEIVMFGPAMSEGVAVPVPPLGLPKIPPRVSVPVPMIGPPVRVRPVDPPLPLTLTTVPVQGNPMSVAPVASKTAPMPTVQ